MARTKVWQKLVNSTINRDDSSAVNMTGANGHTREGANRPNDTAVINQNTSRMHERTEINSEANTTEQYEGQRRINQASGLARERKAVGTAPEGPERRTMNALAYYTPGTQHRTISSAPEERNSQQIRRGGTEYRSGSDRVLSERIDPRTSQLYPDSPHRYSANGSVVISERNSTTKKIL